MGVRTKPAAVVKLVILSFALSMTGSSCPPAAPRPPETGGGGPVGSATGGLGTIDGHLEAGEYTNERPEVGYLSTGCTATLIAPRLILAAGHCFAWESSLEAPRGTTLATFEMKAADGKSSRRAGVTQITNLDQYGVYNTHDVAIASLEACVDDFATPAKIGAARPTSAVDVEQFGYGCRSRDPWCKTGKKPFIDGNKQKVTFKWGEGKASCPGDSGGPIFWSGNVVGVASGAYVCGEAADVYGDPVPHALHVDLARAMPCSGWMEALGVVHVSDPLAGLPHTSANKEVSWQLASGTRVRLFGGYTREVEFLDGEPVEIRHLGENVATVLGYRPKGVRVLFGIAKLDEDGTVWIQGPNKRIYLQTDGPSATPARILDGLKKVRGKRVMVKGSISHTLKTIEGRTETVAVVGATDAIAAFGLY